MARNAVGTTTAPRSRSTKYKSGSGGDWPKLVADRLFNGILAHAIVFGEVVHGITRLDPPGNHAGLDPAGQHERPAETVPRVDGDELRRGGDVDSGAVSGHGEQSNRCPGRGTIDARQVLLDDVTNRSLARAR